MNLEPVNEQIMERATLTSQTEPSSGIGAAVEASTEVKESTESSGGERSWAERFQECVTDDGFVDGKLGEFVTLVGEASTTQQDDQLLAPLLTADPDVMKALVVEHGIMDFFENWLRRTEKTQRIVLLVLKVIDRFLKRVQEIFHFLNVPLLRYLMSLKEPSKDPMVAASAAAALTPIRYFFHENDDPAFHEHREAVHEKQRRIFAEGEEDSETAPPIAKRASPLDAGAASTPYPGNAPFIPAESTIDMKSTPSSSKSGKPKKNVRWASDEDHEVLEFFKDYPVRLGAGGIAAVVPSEGFGWLLYKFNFRDNVPLLVSSTRRVQLTQPTMALEKERERQKTESIILHLNDSDIPPNPSEAPGIQDRSNFALHSATPVHVPFTSRLPVLSHVQLPHLSQPDTSRESSHETYYTPQLPNHGLPSLDQHHQLGYMSTPNYSPQMPPSSYSSSGNFDPYGPNHSNTHTHNGSGPTGPHNYNSPMQQQNLAPSSQSFSQPGFNPAGGHNAPNTYNPSGSHYSGPNQPSYDPYGRNQPHPSSNASFPQHGQPQPSHSHQNQSRPQYPPKMRPSDLVDPSEVYETSFQFSRLKAPKDRSRFVCRQWRTSGGKCEYGAACNFLHPKDNSKF